MAQKYKIVHFNKITIFVFCLTRLGVSRKNTDFLYIVTSTSSFLSRTNFLLTGNLGHKLLSILIIHCVRIEGSGNTLIDETSHLSFGCHARLLSYNRVYPALLCYRPI